MIKAKPRGRHITPTVKAKVYKEKIKLLDIRFKEALITFQGTINAALERTTDESIKPLLRAALNDKPYRTNDLIRKMIKDRNITGECSVCAINCYGTEAMPRHLSFPCGINQCPYENRKQETCDNTVELTKQLKKDFLYD